MSTTFTSVATFVTITCYKCGIEFGVPTHFKLKRVEDKQIFWCPNGHSQAYVESDADRLKKQLEQERANTAWYRERAEDRAKQLETERHRTNGYKGALAKTKKRIAHGVCPCCQRTFQNVQRHMTSQHPSYAEQAPKG